jgi:hypothetical protein
MNIKGFGFEDRYNMSATGDFFSDGEKKIEGDFLINAQGEDVVAGIRITNDLAHMRQEMPALYSEFAHIAERLGTALSRDAGCRVSIEQGKLFIDFITGHHNSSDTVFSSGNDAGGFNFIADFILQIFTFFIHPNHITSVFGCDANPARFPIILNFSDNSDDGYFFIALFVFFFHFQTPRFIYQPKIFLILNHISKKRDNFITLWN